MFKKTSISRTFFLTIIYFSLAALTACGQNSSKSKIPLVPEPSLGKGIYSLNGLYAGEGLIWSPNGKTLAGLISDLPLPDYCSPFPIFCLFDNYKPHSEIFLIDIKNWQRQTILYTEYGKKDIYAISWFPDSQQIMYGADTKRPGYFGQLWLISVDGQNDHLYLDEDGRPVWSPDGSKIALGSSIGGPGNWYPAIFLFDVSNGQKEMIYKGAEPISYLSHLSWSPDGKVLAFSYGKIGANATPKPNIFFLDLENYQVIQITNDEFEYWSAYFSPNGKLIALQRVDNNSTNFDNSHSTIIKDLDKNCEIRLPVYTDSVSWSPDGQKLVVTSGRKAYIVDLSEFIGQKFNETGSVCP